jgi:hypothetical protein
MLEDPWPRPTTWLGVRRGFPRFQRFVLTRRSRRRGGRGGKREGSSRYYRRVCRARAGCGVGRRRRRYRALCRAENVATIASSRANARAAARAHARAAARALAVARAPCVVKDWKYARHSPSRAGSISASLRALREIARPIGSKTVMAVRSAQNLAQRARSPQRVPDGGSLTIAMRAASSTSPV